MGRRIASSGKVEDPTIGLLTIMSGRWSGTKGPMIRPTTADAFSMRHCYLAGAAALLLLCGAYFGCRGESPAVSSSSAEGREYQYHSQHLPPPPGGGKLRLVQVAFR